MQFVCLHIAYEQQSKVRPCDPVITAPLLLTKRQCFYKHKSILQMTYWWRYVNLLFFFSLSFSLPLSLPLSFLSPWFVSLQDSTEWSKNERKKAGRKAWTGGLLSSSTSCLYGAVSQCSPPTRSQLGQTNMSPRNLIGLFQTGGLSTTPGATYPLWKDTVKDLQPDIKYTGMI